MFRLNRRKATPAWSGMMKGALGASFGLLVCCSPAHAASTTRVSVSSSGAQSNVVPLTDELKISGNGRFVVFTSEASNLVADDTNNTTDVFVRDLQTNATTRVSVNNAGIQGERSSFKPSISADGRFVAFYSNANNLVPDDTNNYADVFVRDRQMNTTTRVSVTTEGVQGDVESFNPVISADGRFVAFVSASNSLVNNDNNSSSDVFVHDLQTGITSLVSVNTATSVDYYGDSDLPSLSADGRFVAFESDAANLVSGDTNGQRDIFVRDRQTNATFRVSLSSPGAQGNSSSQNSSISADGRYVAFDSSASTFVSGDTNDSRDVFVRDRQTNTTTRVSVDNNGVQGDSDSSKPSMSADDRYVAFESDASNLVGNDANGSRDIFVRDRQANTTTRVSVSSSGVPGNDDSSVASISSDGRFVAFASDADNLISGDTNALTDVFVRDRLSDGSFPSPPQVGSLSPPSALDAPNTARTFTAIYSDPDGAADINLVALRIGGSASNSANSLLCVYNATTNKLSIYNDAGTAAIGSVTPRTNTVLSNSQGSLNCGATTVSKSGNVLTVNWNVSATGAFAGTKQTTFLFVRDTGNLSEGYTAKGTWTINGNARPSTVSVSPASVSTSVGVEQFFTTTFSDTNGFKNLQFATLRLGGSSTSSSGAMVCVYNVQNNKLYLFDDAGNYVPQADFPGRSTVLQNSQGSLDCARTTVTGSSNTLTVKWSVKAKAAFAGSRAIALLCADRANLRDGYDTYGTWTIGAAGGAAAASVLSTATASGQSVNLVFTGAAPQSGYAVSVNGAPVEVTSASVKGSKVSLSLAASLHSGDQVVVTWDGGSTTIAAS